MRKIKIVSDSACDLSALDYASFSYAPMKIITADTEFIDDDNLDVDDMVHHFNQYKGKSKSSCPNTGDWIEAFKDADDVFCVTITSGLSGSYNSACAAKQIFEAENEGKRVFVLDSLSAGPEITLITKKLEEYVKAGKEYEEICRSILEYRETTGLLFMLKSLKNFANNGRVSPIVAKIVGIAGICVVGKASQEGTLEPLHKCRGELRSFEAILKELEDAGFKGGKISIGHCQNENGANRISEMIQEEYSGAQIEIHKLRGLCSFYAELGGILLGFEKC